MNACPLCSKTPCECHGPVSWGAHVKLKKALKNTDELPEHWFGTEAPASDRERHIADKPEASAPSWSAESDAEYERIVSAIPGPAPKAEAPDRADGLPRWVILGNVKYVPEKPECRHSHWITCAQHKPEPARAEAREWWIVEPRGQQDCDFYTVSTSPIKGAIHVREVLK